MEKKLLTALHQAVQFLKREKIPFVVIGGLANSVIGEPRSTRDVDLKVYLEGRTGQEFADLVAKELAPAELLPAGSPLIVSIITSPNVIIDFLIAIPGYEDEVLARAPIVRIGNLQVPVCTPEDFIIYKVVADRPKDWGDIEGVVNGHRTNLDQAYIHYWLEQFAEILERPDWIVRYDDLVSKFV